MTFRRSISLATILAAVAMLAACASSHSSMPPPPTVSITATAGGSQSAAIGTAFGAQLQATVRSNGSPASGVSVTFTAPSSGASGTFATSPAAATDTETTDSNGIATSQIFTANTTAGAYAVTASTAGANSPANFNLTNMTGAPASVAASSGDGQSAIVGAAFGNPLVATVTDSGGNPVAGASVTFTAPAAGASATFATNPASATDTETTDSNGNATSQILTADATTGSYAVMASTAGVASPATFNLTNNPLPVISVTIGPSPAALQVSGGVGLTAFVANDLANGGVTWTVTCGSSACGTFSAASVPSGVATDFSAPAAIPTTKVTVTATSVTNPTKSASRAITITQPNSTLANGTYVFSLGGENGNNGTLYYVGGAFQVSGGSITGGEQDYTDNSPIYAQDAITGGSIAIASDGNLTITLVTADPNVGMNGVETLDAALVSPTRARLIEFDNLTSHGRMDLQNGTAAPTAGYAFTVAGLDGASVPVAVGGVINVDNAGGPGNISGNGSVFDINDGNLPGPLQDQTFAPGSVSPPDGFGRVVFNLVPSAASGIPTINLVGYIVDPVHIRLLETSGDSFGGAMGGIAISQETNTGAFSTNSAAGNSYVFGISGFDTSATGVLQSAGVLTTNSDGTVSGAINYNDLAAAQSGPSPVTGTYTVDATGRATLSNVTDGSASFTIQFYLSGQPGESEVVSATMDLDDIQSGLGWLQTGSGSFTGTSLFGSYVLNSTGFDPVNIAEFDAAGPITADGNSSFTGTADLNWLGNTGANITPTVGAPVSGAFTPNANGAFVGTIAGLDVTNCPAFNSSGGGCTSDTFSYYLIDTIKAFAIETDTNQLTLGFLALEQ